ncbi:MAG: class I SAM-dependent methyltransferase [Flexilinea sp.]
MDKKEMKAFFDRLASNWDEDCYHNEAKINKILDYAGITANISVLDVACGTGVLFPYYLQRNVKQIVGVDISTEMIAEAAKKFDDPRVELICDDVESVIFDKKFDRCIIYSALPHFEDPARLIRFLADILLPGGRLTVAHSESRAIIDDRHLNHAYSVSIGLLPEDELAKLFEPFFDVDLIPSNDEMYVVSGVKKHNIL